MIPRMVDRRIPAHPFFMPVTRTALPTSWYLVLGLATLACPSCGVPGTTPRGFDSRQVLAVRDPQLYFGGFNGDESRLYLNRYVQPRPTFGVLPPHDLSTLDLTTSQVEQIAPAVFETTNLAGASGGGRGRAFLHYPSDGDVPADFPSLRRPYPGHLQLSLWDEATGQHVDVSDVADGNPVVFGPSVFDPIAVDRFDTDDNVLPWFGPPDALQPAPSLFARIVGFDATGAFGVAAAAASDAIWSDIQHLPFAGGDRSVVVPPGVGDHVLIADESGMGLEPESQSTGPRDVRYFCVPTTGADDHSRCFFVYSRTGLNGGQERLFARAIGDPRELVLPGALGGMDAVQSATALLWTAAGPTGNHLYSWRFDADRAAGCDVPDGLIRYVTWTTAEDQFALEIAATDTRGYPLPGILVLGAPGGGCRVITPEAMYYHPWTFSPDETVLNWQEYPASGGTTIHLTAVDGSGERRIEMPGSIFFTIFQGDHRLLLQSDSGDGSRLSFIDLTEDPIRDHPVADRTASWVWVGEHWLLLGDAYSKQDDTFTLRAVNIETGASRLLSPSVAVFSPSWTTRPAEATELSVAYLVRGRTPSAQDGIWLAHLPLNDFPP